ncbi:MAG TPA: hypothetical protein VD905_01060, partial [Flavobacteriales bacterium]|nr:hypothetical protein [Flavobacteriales bacterium]
MKTKIILLILLFTGQVNSLFSQACDHTCWLIGNGYFNDIVPGSAIYSNAGTAFQMDLVPCWKESHGTPHLEQLDPYPASCPDPLNPGNCFQDAAFMWHNGNTNNGEGIMQDQTIIQGRKYLLKYKIKNFRPNSTFGPVDHFWVKFINYDASFDDGGSVIPTPINEQEVVHQEPVSATSYYMVCTVITANDNYEAIWFYPEQNPGSGQDFVAISDVVLTEINAGADVTMCSGDTITLGECNLPIFGYSWSPTTGLTNTNTGTPTCTLTNSGTTPITQTYVMSVFYTCNGSVSSLYYDTVVVTVNPSVFASVSGPQTVCPCSTETYTLTNYDPLVNDYTFSIPAATSYSISGNILTVNWGCTPGPAGISITTVTNTTPPCPGSTNSLGVEIVAPPAVPVLDGPLAGCNDDALYTILNDESPEVEYSWSVIGGTITGSTTGASTTIDWSGGTGGTITILAVYSSAPTCTTSQTYTIQPCCNPVDAWLTTWTGNYDNSTDMLTYASSPYDIAFQTIGINDVFLVNQNILFSFCDIYLGPDAKIIMDPGTTLGFRNCNLQACTDMWDGIYSDGTNRVDIINSNVYDAKNVLVTTGGTVVNVDNSNFINNYIGLSFTNHNNFSPVTITRSTFKYDAGLGGLRPPHAGQKSFCGIKLNKVFQLTVGNPSNTVWKNYFQDMNYGIHSTNSYYAIVNNEFSGMNNSENPSNPFLGAAIYSTGYHTLTLVPSFPNPDPTCAYIGKTATSSTGAYKSNTFANNDIGVLMIGHAKTEVYDNDFTDHKKVGVWSLWGANNKDIRIANNTLNNNTVTSTDVLCGISALQSSTSYSARYTISENTISDIRQGINIQNAFRPRVLKNTITVLTPQSGQPWCWGINNKGTLRADIQNNYITGPNFGIESHGIHTEFSPMSLEKCNITEKTFIGLLNMFNSPSSKYTCNTMKENGLGYLNYNGYINNQFTGTPGNEHSAENQWSYCTLHLSTMFPGAVPPIDTWYTRNAPAHFSVNMPGPGGNNYAFIGGTANESNVIWDNNPYNNPVCGCSVFVPGIAEPLSEDESEEIQKEFLQTMNATAENKTAFMQWSEKDALYKELINQSNIPGDADLNAFMNDIGKGNIAALQNGSKQINDYFEVMLSDTLPDDDSLELELGELKVLQEGIIYENTQEYYQQLLNVTRINAMLRALEIKISGAETTQDPLRSTFTLAYPLSSEEIAALEEIASLCPGEMGTVVYEARSLLYVVIDKEYMNDCEMFVP